MNPAMQENGTVLAPHQNSNALRREDDSRPICAQCKREILDGKWFCRLPADEEPLLLCSPSCAIRHFNTSRRHGNNALDHADKGRI